MLLMIRTYVDYNFSISRAFAYYIITHDVDGLITNDIMKDIIVEYKN